MYQSGFLSDFSDDIGLGYAYSYAYVYSAGYAYSGYMMPYFGNYNYSFDVPNFSAQTSGYLDSFPIYVPKSLVVDIQGFLIKSKNREQLMRNSLLTELRRVRAIISRTAYAQGHPLRGEANTLIQKIDQVLRSIQ